MANKYQSNLRTYQARNLLWDKGASPVVLFAMDAPNNIQIALTDTVLQFYRSYGSSGVDWNIAGNVSIKRFGLFSNFADGLVLENMKSRLILSLRTASFSITPVAGTAVFTQGSNYISGTNLNVAFGSGSGFKGFIADDVLMPGANYYSVYDVAVDGLSARISDFAYANAAPASISKLTYDNLQTYSTCRIPVLNTMFESEIFFTTNVTDGTSSTMPLLLAIVNINDYTTFDFYTKTIDTSFNILPVSFDALIELETTPL